MIYILERTIHTVDILFDRIPLIVVSHSLTATGFKCGDLSLTETVITSISSTIIQTSPIQFWLIQSISSQKDHD